MNVIPVFLVFCHSGKVLFLFLIIRCNRVVKLMNFLLDQGFISLSINLRMVKAVPRYRLP